MNILAIDTLSPTLSVAAQGPRGEVTQSFTGKSPSHAEQLLPLIESTVKTAGFTAAETNMVLTPEGPGSFTGLRLGYAAAKALQLTGSTFLAIPTLPCIAFQYQSWNGNIAALIDAKRERFYIQLFKNGKPITEVFDQTAAAMLPYFTQESTWLITGYGTNIFQSAPLIMQNAARFQFIEANPLSFAHTMLKYARENADTLTEPDDYKGPYYIRKSDAEKE